MLFLEAILHLICMSFFGSTLFTWCQEYSLLLNGLNHYLYHTIHNHDVLMFYMMGPKATPKTWFWTSPFLEHEKLVVFLLVLYYCNTQGSYLPPKICASLPLTTINWCHGWDGEDEHEKLFSLLLIYCVF